MRWNRLWLNRAPTLWAIWWAAVVLAVVVIGAYGILGPGSVIGSRISQDAEDWARFGEYVGGTLGVLFALLALAGVLITINDDRHQRAEERRTETSKIYFEQADRTLSLAMSTFTSKLDGDGRPINDRRHWLTFARGLKNAQLMAERIETEPLREAWRLSEQRARDTLYDLLKPTWDSYPGEYYGYVSDDDKHKNLVQTPGVDREPLAEQSLVMVYRWVQWPDDVADVVDRTLRFSDQEIEKMGIFGPRGLAHYIQVRREVTKMKAKDSQGRPGVYRSDR